MARERKIHKIVLTGGPCAGKSTALSRLRESLEAYGLKVFIVQEVATKVITSGMKFGEIAENPEKWRLLQTKMLKAQIRAEEEAEDFAELLEGDVVFIHDRGAKDGEAYIGREEFQGILYDLHLTEADVNYKRYDAVFFLRTIARDNPKFYNLGNEARTETVEEAVALDERTANSWTGHEHLHIIGNVENLPDGRIRDIPFDEKINNLVREVCRHIQIPVPNNIEKKYLLSPSFDESVLPDDRQILEIEQTYLLEKEPGVERRVRKLQPKGATSSLDALYVYTEKISMGPSSRISTDKNLTYNEYTALLRERDPAKSIVRKKRHSFIWGDQYFQVDQLYEPGKVNIMEIDLTDNNVIPNIPDFLPIQEDVTENHDYRMASIARGSLHGENKIYYTRKKII